MSLIVSSYGAELLSVVAGGKERLWQNQTGEWAHCAPVLFPVCGNCGIRVRGKDYPVLPHGFARRSEFTLVQEGSDFFTFELRNSKETEKIYPYSFIFRIAYRLCMGNTLQIESEICNPSQTKIYASCGGHESFALENPVGCYEIVFPEEESFVTLLHDEFGKLTGKSCNFGTGKILPLPAEFLRDGRTAIFAGLKSRSACLRERGGKDIAKIMFEGFENLLLWHPGNSRMICMEPWRNLPDAVGEEKEFSDKGGIFSVEGGKTKKFIRTVTYK